MIVGRNEVQQLKAAGYTYHELAEIAKCPTPTVMQLGQYGTAPDRPIELDVKALLDAKTPKPIALDEKSDSTKTKEGK